MSLDDLTKKVTDMIPDDLEEKAKDVLGNLDPKEIEQKVRDVVPDDLEEKADGFIDGIKGKLGL